MTIQPRDDGEDTSIMMPMLVGMTSKHRGALVDLATELAIANAGFEGSLPKATAEALADLTRSMNCYYSNLIEGHNTHPIDIERALNNEYSDDQEKRDLQIEAKAHIEVQKWIDDGNLDGKTTSPDGICEIHKRFCERLPDELLWVENVESGVCEHVVPGEFRTGYVEVGRHIPISPGAIPRFMETFDDYFRKLGKSDRIISVAGAHHRFLWIHPFLDGNGRVARLMSHAMLSEAIGTTGLWSIARGLARNKNRYYEHLAACDKIRQGDLDGRGSRSEAALAEFSEFFIKICIDQVAFMEQLMDPKRLQIRIERWANEEVAVGNLSKKAAGVLRAILRDGQLGRGEIPAITNTTDRQARNIVSELTKLGIVRSKTSRAPLCIAFPAKYAGYWLPSLFPDDTNIDQNRQT